MSFQRITPHRGSSLWSTLRDWLDNEGFPPPPSQANKLMMMITGITAGWRQRTSPSNSSRTWRGPMANFTEWSAWWGLASVSRGSLIMWLVSSWMGQARVLLLDLIEGKKMSSCLNGPWLPQIQRRGVVWCVKSDFFLCPHSRSRRDPLEPSHGFALDGLNSIISPPPQTVGVWNVVNDPAACRAAEASPLN